MSLSRSDDDRSRSRSRRRLDADIGSGGGRGFAIGRLEDEDGIALEMEPLDLDEDPLVVEVVGRVNWPFEFDDDPPLLDDGSFVAPVLLALACSFSLPFPFPNQSTPFAASSLSFLLCWISRSTSSIVRRSRLAWLSIFMPSSPICLVSWALTPAADFPPLVMVCFFLRPVFEVTLDVRECTDDVPPPIDFSNLIARSSSRVSKSLDDVPAEEDDAFGLEEEEDEMCILGLGADGALTYVGLEAAS